MEIILKILNIVIIFRYFRVFFVKKKKVSVAMMTQPLKNGLNAPQIRFKKALFYLLLVVIHDIHY